MRSYGQYCSVAKSLDVIGDRWTLLIVRELLGRGPSRYTDLRGGLAGIASNLLASRLRELEAAGLVRRYDAPPPVATTLFELTERGAALEPVLTELGRWGAALMVDYRADDEFRGHWLRLHVRLYLSDHDPERPKTSVLVEADGQAVTIDAAAGQVSLRLVADPTADVTIAGTPPQVLSVLAGRRSVAEAEAGGLQVSGSRDALERILPRPVEAAGSA